MSRLNDIRHIVGETIPAKRHKKRGILHFGRWPSLAVPKIKMLEDLFDDFFILYDAYHAHFIRALMASICKSEPQTLLKNDMCDNSYFCIIWKKWSYPVSEIGGNQNCFFQMFRICVYPETIY